MSYPAPEKKVSDFVLLSHPYTTAFPWLGESIMFARVIHMLSGLPGQGSDERRILHRMPRSRFRWVQMHASSISSLVFLMRCIYPPLKGTLHRYAGKRGYRSSAYSSLHSTLPLCSVPAGQTRILIYVCLDPYMNVDYAKHLCVGTDISSRQELPERLAKGLASGCEWWLDVSCTKTNTKLKSSTP